MLIQTLISTNPDQGVIKDIKLPIRILLRLKDFLLWKYSDNHKQVLKSRFFFSYHDYKKFGLGVYFVSKQSFPSDLQLVKLKDVPFLVLRILFLLMKFRLLKSKFFVPELKVNFKCLFVDQSFVKSLSESRARDNLKRLL